MSATERLEQLIRREGPIPFDRFVEVALYEPGAGFFATGRGPGRAGRDFVTSPETGSLFGRLVARALDRSWGALGRPDPFVVVDAGAGTGRLAREVLRAGPACAPALRYVMVERSAALRTAQRELVRVEPADEAFGPYVEGPDDERTIAPGSGPVVTAIAELPALEVEGVVIANELLDNLPFGVAVRRDGGWCEVMVALDGDGGFDEVVVPASRPDAAALDATTAGVVVPDGVRLPIPRGIDGWVEATGAMLRRGHLVAIDYTVSAAAAITRGGWLRTYRAHAAGESPLWRPGEQDITADVVVEHLERSARAHGFVPVSRVRQADWLRSLGIDDDVNVARDTWRARAHIGDLEAIAARSVVHEADALCDPTGLGAHTVCTFTRGGAPPPPDVH
ncbi:MAG TPA: SAM-dependent methyltransferase [Acidimicrobiia bacterium]|nr:SAM-dependent methyltransferase [Acidimicrobiia bacterium]